MDSVVVDLPPVTLDAAAGAQMPVASLRDHLYQLLKILQDQARNADTKAAAIAAVTSALVGWVLFRGAPSLPSQFGWYNIVLVPALIVATIGDMLSILVLLPRAWSPRKPGGVFFGDIARYDGPDAFWADLQKQGEVDLARQLADEVHVVARIVARKYALVRWAGWLALGGGLASLAAVAART